MKRIHTDAYTAALGLAVLAGAIAAILAALNPIR